MVWEGKYGPAFLVGVAQFLLFAGGLVGGYQVIKDNQAVQQDQTRELKAVVSELRQSAEATGNRVTKVEATVDGINHSLDRIERKVEAISR